MGKLAVSHRDLDVFKWAVQGAVIMSRLAAKLPQHEFRMADQMRRCGRSPVATVCEAWQKRRYPAQWISKLSDAQAESAEAQGWIEIALSEGFISQSDYDAAFKHFESQIAQLVAMTLGWKRWVLARKI
jgi:four helix bundle protein